MAMACWVEAEDLRELASKVIAARDDVEHVDVNEVLFLWEMETKPKAYARCYRLIDHPIGLFTPHRWCIVFYAMICEHMDERQRALLMWHELKHIPALGKKLIDHDLKDFIDVVGLAGVEWAEEGADVPDILRA
jgi:predicted metallopeptidase